MSAHTAARVVHPSVAFHRTLTLTAPALICMVIVLCLPWQRSHAAEPAAIKAYVINLESSQRPLAKPDPRKYPELAGFHIHTLTFLKSGTKWYRLRVGFFTEHRDAILSLRAVKKHFPQAWVDRINPAENALALAWFKRNDAEPVALKAAAVSPVGAGTKAADLMERARQAVIDGNFTLAISLYTKVISITRGEAQKDAREFLGLAREKNGQAAHAKAEYEEYLRLFPEGPDAERVRQRLLGIVTARSSGRDKLSADGKTAPKVEWDIINSLTQFYRYQRSDFDMVGVSTTDNSLDTSFNSNGRYRGLNYDMKFQIDASYRYIFLDVNDPSDPRLSTAYFDVSRKGEGLSLRVGRQTHNSDGVLGRFDGLILGYRFKPQWKLNLLYGNPVDLTVSNDINPDRYFEGVSLNIGTLAKHWNLNIYGIRQYNDDLLDRAAIGGEVKYVADTYSTLTLLDYDYDYGELNTLLFVGNWRLQNQGTINLTVDYRNSPPLTTSNALLGQTVTSLTELLQTYSEGEIRQLAQDRTARYTSTTLSGTLPLNKVFQFNADLTLSSLAATPDSGGVAATPSSGTEVFASTQLTADNLFKINETSILGLRQSDTNNASTTTATFSMRFPFRDKWRINPQLRIDDQSRADGTEVSMDRLSLKLDYRHNRDWKWEFEAGNEETETRDLDVTHDSNIYIYAGYIYDF